MIERIGTMRETGQIEDKIPEDALRDLIHFITILDGEYGEYRKYDVYFRETRGKLDRLEFTNG